MEVYSKASATLLTIPRFGASGEVGPWFLPLNYCGRGENPQTECLLHHPCDLYIILQIGAHHPHPKRHCYLETNFGPYNLGIRQWNAVIWCLLHQKKSAKQICPNFGQIKRIEFQPGLTEATTLIILPTKNVLPSERLACSMIEGITSIGSYQIVLLRCSLSPKWPFWMCGDFRLHPWKKYWNHAMILGNQTCLHRDFPSGTFVFKRNINGMSSSLATHHSVLPSGVNSWKAAGLGAGKRSHGVAWYRMVSLVKSQVFYWTFEANLHVTDTGRKTPLHVIHACKPHSTAMLLWMMIFAYTAWWVWKLRPAATVERLSTLTIPHYCWFRDSQSNGLRLGLKAQKKLKTWPGRHKRQNHVHHNFENLSPQVRHFLWCRSSPHHPKRWMEAWWLHMCTVSSSNTIKSQEYVINLTVTWSYTLKIN